MRSVLEFSSWRMLDAKPYGLFHLSFFIIGIIVSVFIAYKLRKVSDKTNKRILFGIGLFLFIIEIYKELFYYYIINNNHYDFSIFPFQLCDVPIYICLLAPFIKNKKVEEASYNFMVSYNLLGGFITFFEPSGILRPYLMMTLHGFIWHMLLVFTGLYLAFSNRCLKNKKDFITSIKVYGALSIIALIINFVSNAKINAFYLGPKTSPIIVFSTISKTFGWFPNMIIYILLMTLGAYLVYLLMYNIKKKVI